ncbi:MAG: 2-hydroxychromene-2-carboxylate isomerase [Alphaproteobacteria bacterium]
MSKTVEFFFDFGSPATFLAYTQVAGIAERTGANLVWKPMLLGGVFKATGNASPVLIPAKGRWMGRDLARWAKRYQTEISYPAGFPLNTLPLMRGAVGYLREDEAQFHRYVDLIFRSIWQNEVDIRDQDRFGALLAENDFDPGAFLVMISDQEVKDDLMKRTEEAVERGVFGAPTFFVDGELHFGQDRLEWVEEAASA